MSLFRNLENKIGRINLLLLIYSLVNLFQSIFTYIHDDEAYYWIYSKDLEWGYFDHPPAIALLVKIGGLFFSSEIGVRLMTVLLSFITAKLIWNLIPENIKVLNNSELIFFAILIAVPGFNIYSFITTPDVPLIFSFALYLHALKRINEKKSLINAVLWAIAASLLIYSKYHGGIIILVSIIVQPKLLKNWTTYFTGFLALLLITPHLYWQYNNDFVTFDYHLFQRTSGAFSIENPFGYIVGALGVLNPALMVIMILLTFKYKKLISKEYKLYFRMFWGIVIFFFFYSFRARIEAHWVVAAFIPMTILLHNLVVKHHKYQKSIKNIAIVSVILLSLARLALVFPTPLQSLVLKYNNDFYQDIENVADGKNVVFLNTYQKAAKYEFFTGKKSYSLNSIYYRKNIYDLANYEKDFNNADVFFVGKWKSNFLDTLKLEHGKTIRYAEIDDFSVFTKTKGKIIGEFPQKLKKGKYNINIELYNPYNYDLHFGEGTFPLKLQLVFAGKGRKWHLVDLNNDMKILKSKSTIIKEVNFDLGNNVPQGEYEMQIVINSIYPLYISKKYKVVIDNNLLE